MDAELAENFSRIEALVRELGKRFGSASDENVQLHGLITAMESDTKKAMRMINEFERMQRERERVKDKISELLDKFDRLRIS